MTNRNTMLVTLSLSMALAGTACSRDRANHNAASGTGGGTARGDQVTVAGCLSGGADGRLVLTAAPDPGVTAPARVGMGGERDTHSYVLVGGNNLQQHIGKRVEVKGTLSGRQEELERESKSEAQSPPATGTSGRETPTVKTKEDLDLEVRQLTVSDVREVAPSCQVNP